MADTDSEEKRTDTEQDSGKQREEINADLQKQREAMTKGVYAGPDIMSMMMVYAGPAQMQNGGSTQSFAQFMLAYAGPQPNGQTIGNTMEMMRQGGIRPQPREGTYCFCPECGKLATLNFCPDCGTPLKDQPRYRDCPDCGTRLDAGSKFCHECGKLQNTGENMMA